MRSVRTILALQAILLLTWSCACSDRLQMQTACPPGQEDCDGVCVVLDDNPNHCGACDRRCPAEMVCSMGRCAVGCDDGLELCDRSCVDTSRDERNCGGCAFACAPGISCEAGRCACPEGTTACDGVCADLASDPENCGACGAHCAGGLCEAGACRCLEGWTLCDGSCVNLVDDPAHCGSCHRACEAGAVCTDGTCPCPDGLTDCGPEIGCVDLESDGANCGTCGNECGEAPCMDGVCFCPPGTTFCEGECVDLETDHLHCGACGRSCEDRPNASRGICGAGTCYFSCNPDFQDCDEDPVNGCEVRVRDDVQNCGACGHDCRSLPNTQSVQCRDGTCSFTCKSGWGDCDQDPNNGCETDLNRSASHCGSCRTVCDGPCSAGACSGPIQISTGGQHTCATTQDGSVYCWGDNDYGQTGPDAEKNEYKATRIPGLGPAKQVAAGGFFTCALLRTGEVACWGDGKFGQMGNGSLSSRAVPTIVPELDQVVQISTGGATACALRASGELLCWGSNSYGQLGNGTTQNSPNPVPVSLDEKPIYVNAGAAVCALTDQKRVWCWGRNQSMQIGDGTTDDRHTPFRLPTLENVKYLMMGHSSHAACVILESGEVRCWGANHWGGLGDGTQENRSEPVLVQGLLGEEVAGLGMGGLHACAHLADGKAMCWGHNSSGQLGIGTRGNDEWAGSPVEVLEIDGEVVEMGGGNWHTCARLANGRVMCWGQNNSGQVGHPNEPGTSSRLLPVPVQWR